MPKGIDLGSRPQEGLKQILGQLMEAGGFQGVVSLGLTAGGAVDYHLMMKAQGTSSLRPLHPFMPNHVGRLLRELTLGGPLDKRLLVITRPCELRGSVEMVKRLQVDPTNMVFLSMVCGGVFPLTSAVSGHVEGAVKEYWSDLGRRTLPEVRPACRGCTEFIPYTADLMMTPVQGGGWSLVAKSEEGSRVMEGAFPSAREIEVDQGSIDAMAEEREKGRQAVLNGEANVKGLKDLVKVFGRCIGCHACSKSCPICYCTLCTFESSRMEARMEQVEGQLEVRGGVRAPTGTTLFHLGRMGHMAFSCVACGCCQDVCPTDIPVSLIFKKVGEAVQARFDYVPGRDREERMPLNTFKPVEFKEMGE